MMGSDGSERDELWVGVTSYKWRLLGWEGGEYTQGPIFLVRHCAAALLMDGVGLGSGLEWGGLLVRGASKES